MELKGAMSPYFRFLWRFYSTDCISQYDTRIFNELGMPVVVHCVVPENIHYPTEGFFGLNPPPPWNFQFSFILPFKNSGFGPPSPLEIPMTFHGVGMDIFWNYTLYERWDISFCIPQDKVWFIESKQYTAADITECVWIIVMCR